MKNLFSIVSVSFKKWEFFTLCALGPTNPMVPLSWTTLSFALNTINTRHDYRGLVYLYVRLELLISVLFDIEISDSQRQGVMEQDSCPKRDFVQSWPTFYKKPCTLIIFRYPCQKKFLETNRYYIFSNMQGYNNILRHVDELSHYSSTCFVCWILRVPGWQPGPFSFAFINSDL